MRVQDGGVEDVLQGRAVGGGGEEGYGDVVLVFCAVGVSLWSFESG